MLSKAGRISKKILGRGFMKTGPAPLNKSFPEFKHIQIFRDSCLFDKLVKGVPYGKRDPSVERLIFFQKIFEKHQEL